MSPHTPYVEQSSPTLSIPLLLSRLRLHHLRLLDTLPPHAPTKHERRRRGPGSKIEGVLHSLVVRQEDTTELSVRYNLSYSRSTRSNDRFRADVGSEDRYRLFQAVREVCFGKCQE